MNWREFVKQTQSKYGISYKEAMKKASPLWKEYKDKPAKKPRKKKKKGKVELPEDVIDFPKSRAKKKKDVKQKIPQTQAVVKSDLGGTMGEEIDRRRERPVKGRKRLARKHGIVLDSTHRYMARKSKVLSRF